MKPLVSRQFCWNPAAGGGVPGHAGEQWSGGLRSGGAEGDGPVLLRADGQTAARQVELGPFWEPETEQML